MIPLLLIILFIIFLLYVLRKRHVEEYLIEGVNLSWRNKTGVEGIVNKWILVVKDTQGNEIHRTENSDLNNRKNDTDVTLNVFTNKTFGDNIIGNNTIDIYYNDGSGDKIINTQILRFEKDEFSEDISGFEFRDLDISAWENAQNKDCVGVYSKVKKDKSTPGTDKFGCGPSDDPNKHNCQFWKYTHDQKQLGTGKPCTRDEGHVIKVQWPKKANTDRVGLQFVDDPDPNTDSKVADTPQHYKSLFDQQQAVVDAQEKENAKIAKEAADKAAAEALGGLIPNQTKLGDDGFCSHGGVVIHQVDGDVNTAKGCKRICSDTNNVWTRDTSHGTWDSNEANRIVEECTDAKLDIIWEKDGDGKRKLRSGFTTSKDYVQTFTFPETFTYELIMNKKNAYLGIHIEYIKLDGVLATKAQTTIHKNPNRNNKPDNMFSIGSGTENYASWNSNGHNKGDKIFTIVSDKKVDKIDIVYTRPRYAPGWIIKENGVTKITETSNRGGTTEPRPVVYTYDIKNGKSTIFSIPNQISLAPHGGWCNHANAVHQYVPGCGRICSDPSNVGRKSMNKWGSWNNYPGSVDCPAAKLDEVYQVLNGKRSLRVGKKSKDLFASNEKFYMKGGKDGKYCADEGNSGTKCNRPTIGGWEAFKSTKNSDGTYSLRGGHYNHGRYCADEGNTIKCNRTKIDRQEKFTVQMLDDGKYSLKGGKHGKYCADESNTIRCSRNSVGGWEKFEVGKI